MCLQLGGLLPSRIFTSGCFVLERGFFGAARSPMPARSSLVLGRSGFPWAFSGMALHLGVQWSDQVSWAGLGADLDSEGEPLVTAGEGAHGCDILVLCLSPSLHGSHPGPGLEAPLFHAFVAENVSQKYQKQSNLVFKILSQLGLRVGPQFCVRLCN